MGRGTISGNATRFAKASELEHPFAGRVPTQEDPVTHGYRYQFPSAKRRSKRVYSQRGNRNEGGH
jgi:hypothetical protein